MEYMRTIGFLYAVAAAVIWGLSYTLDQKILTKISPLTLIFVGSLLGALITLPFALADRQSIKTLLESGKNNFLLIFAAVALATLGGFFIFSSIKILGASTASLFEIAYPFFVVLFSFLIFKTTPNLSFMVGAILMFLGSFVIIRFG